MENRIVLQLSPSEKNPRNSEGSFIQLSSGRILFIYTHYYGGCQDHDNAHLASRYSLDDGLTWSKEDEVVIPNEGKCNVMSVSLLRLKSGKIALFYLVKNGNDDCRSKIRISEDEAETWQEPVGITEPIGYYTVNNDRVIQTRSGRIIVPSGLHKAINGIFRGSGTLIYFLSDDEGRTWMPSKIRHSARPSMEVVCEEPDLPEPEEMAKGKKYILLKKDPTFEEPGVVELKDGKIYSFIRTSLGCQYQSFSEDDGETWTYPEPSSLLAPTSPAGMKRIPATGDLLVVWNDRSDRYGLPKPSTQSWGRTPLVCAISRDEGRTWEKFKPIETDPYNGFCYASIFFVKDKIIISYQSGGKDTGDFVLARNTLRRIDLEWLYN